MTHITHAMVFAGGLGTRLGELGSSTPKALLPIDGYQRLIDVVLSGLRSAGVTDVTLAVCHRAEAIMSALGDGAEHGVRITYHVERTPLGTAGALAFMQSGGAPFLVTNCDVVSDLDLTELVRGHARSGAELTIAAHRHIERSAFAVLETDDPFQSDPVAVVRSIAEKPTRVELLNMGMYVVDPTALDVIEPGQPIGMDEVIQSLLDDGRDVATFIHDGEWLDVGCPASVARLAAPAREPLRKIA